MGSFYSEHVTWLHRCPVWIKLGLLAVLGVLMSVSDSRVMLATVLGCSGTIYLSLGSAQRSTQRLLGLVLVSLLLITGFHVFNGRLDLALLSSTRVLSLTLLGASLAVTTRPTDLLQTLEWVLHPLRWMGVKTPSLSLQLGLMLRFAEHFFVMWQRMDDAFYVRTGRRRHWRLVAHLCVRMLCSIGQVADALAVRLGSRF